MIFLNQATATLSILKSQFGSWLEPERVLARAKWGFGSSQIEGVIFWGFWHTELKTLITM